VRRLIEDPQLAELVSRPQEVSHIITKR